MGARLRCYAWGGSDGWEAICIDLDIAVTGQTFNDVKGLLNEAIATYVADAEAEEPAVARRLLSRKSPWWVRAWIQFQFALFAGGRSSNGDNAGARHAFHCPA